MSTFVRLVREVKGQKALFLWTVVLAAISQTAPALAPAIMGRILTDVVDHHRLDRLVAYFFATLALAAVGGVLHFYSTVIGVTFGQHLMRDIRRRLYRNLTAVSFSYYDRMRTGDLMSRVTNDLEPMGEFFVFSGRMVLRSIALFVFALAVCLWTDWRLALACLGMMPFVTISSVVLGMKIRPAYQRARELLSEVSTRLQESISAIIVVKAYCREEREIERFDQNSRALREANYRADAIDALYFPLTGFFAGLAIIASIWYGGWLAITESLTYGQFMQFFVYLNFLVVPLRMTGWGVSAGMRAVAAARRVYEIEDAVPDVTPPEEPAHPGRIRGEIAFENVHFAYDAGEPVLRGVTLRLEPGQTLGILGGVGSGKSTLAALVARFYDPTEGRVLIDGTDVRELDLAELRSQIGVVFQDSFLFSGAIRENVAFGRPDATDEEIRDALRKAAILDFVEGLEDGLDTQIGERGMRLSGGQQQRLAIARAILTDPRILILDSCTSNVDTYTEYLIQGALTELMKGRTTIVIAHRASSLATADRVIVLHEGQVRQDGAPEELAQDAEGMYARLEALQHDLEGMEAAS